MRYQHYMGQDAGRVYDLRLLRRLGGFMWPYRYRLLLALGLLLLCSLLGLAGPYLVKVAIDEHIQQRDVAGLAGVAFLYVVILAAEFGLRYWQIYTLQYVGQQVMVDLRRVLLEHLDSLELGYFDRHPVGGIMTRLIGDVEVLNEMVSAGVVSILGDVVALLGIVGMLLYLDWRLALVVFSVLPLLFLTSIVFRQKVRASFRLIRRRLAELNAYLQESLSGMLVVQLFNRQAKNFAKFAQVGRRYLEAYLQTIFYYSLFFPAVEILSSLAIALIIWYGGGEVVQGTLTLGVLVAFIEYAQRFFRPINDLSEKYNVLQSAMAAAERIFNLLDTEPKERAVAAPQVIPGRVEEVRFEEVSFAYQPGEDVLQGVSFSVRRGERVALVGLSGAGKTSIISLLMRFYEPTGGRITVNGIDLCRLDLADWRRRLGLVQQEPFVFSGTVLENIRLGDERITVSAAEQAAERTKAADFIRRLPSGYNTHLQERGANLSVGERQLLTFARALAHDPEILLLDEATSSVDPHTEQLIQQAIEELLRQRTSIIVAHRLSTIRQVDRILVLDQGQIVEEGTHAQLLARDGLYAYLHRLQFLHPAGREPLACYASVPAEQEN